jgi:hypothetical protein
MVDFPTREREINRLATRMVSGYTVKAADFPHNGRVRVSSLQTAYAHTVQVFLRAASAERVAARASQKSLKALALCMKAMLRKAEVDVANDPVKLAWIGWGPKAAPQKLVAPASPRELKGKSLEEGKVKLSWKRPVGGGAVWNYWIEGKFDGEEGWGEWRFIRSTYGLSVTFKNPVESGQMEFRVIAGNPAGMSAPSNSVTVVLEQEAVV